MLKKSISWLSKVIVLSLFTINFNLYAQYKGTASVSQGLGIASGGNLFNCSGARVAAIGTSKAADNSEWIVPASNNFTNINFPFASDLYNSCNNNTFTHVQQAIESLSGNDIITIDTDGELITAFVFCDNYFEMYINGNPVGKDKVPFTPFNSSIIRFKVKKPFTIAMLLIDWEENLGLGTENNGGFKYHPGDGGLVAVFKNDLGETIAKTDSTWLAQTYYTAPIYDLNCPYEIGHVRFSENCSVNPTNDGANAYALHWKKPENWMLSSADDGAWPYASCYANQIVGVDNKPAYTNFAAVFDDPLNDASFIWSNNLILDNEVIVKKIVYEPSGISDVKSETKQFLINPNPAKNYIKISYSKEIKPELIKNISIYNSNGQIIKTHVNAANTIPTADLIPGNYVLQLNYLGNQHTLKFIIEN